MAEERSLREVARRGYWREEDARVVVGSWRASGRSLRRFCDEHGLSWQRVVRWSRRLGAAAEEVRFHPVQVVARGGGVAADAAIEIELRGGETVRVPPRFSVDDLRNVLEVIDELRRC